MLELHELRIFVAIVEARGFQKASKQLRITQPAVSQSLANLERKVGERLLERSTPVRVTAIGQELLKSARWMLEKETEFIQDLDRLRNGYLQKLSLAVDYLINEHFCHNYVAKALKIAPEMKFKIKRLPAREMIEEVLSGNFEIGFGAFQKDMKKLETIKLFEEKTLLVTGSKNPQIKLYHKDPFAFLKQSVLLSSYLDAPEVRPSKKKIRDYFKDVWEVDNITLQMNLLSKGVGTTYLPETILESDQRAKKFVILDKLPFYAISKPYGLYYVKNSVLSDAAKTFLSITNMS